MTKEVRSKIKDKNKLHKKYRVSHSSPDYLAYCRARNQAKWLCRKAKTQFEKSLAKDAKSNPRAVFKYVNSKLKTKAGIPELTTPNGVAHTDVSKAEALNSFFCSVFSKDDNMLPPTDFPVSSPDIPDTDLIISTDTVCKKLGALNSNKSAGPDNLHPRVLKELAPVISSSLASIMQKSLDTGTVPRNWKDAQIAPIHKKGSKSTVSNYRPVSLTSIPCKLMESIIRDHTMDYLEVNGLLCNQQHGFVRKRSCSTQLIKCLDMWTEALDAGLPLDVIYLDFSKAFDSVPHSGLIAKMIKYQINDKIVQWCSNFLTSRRQKVVLNGRSSQWGEVLSGVPQGSVIGPLLFILFVNDIPGVAHSLIQMFADDIKIFRSLLSPDDHSRLQEDLSDLEQWANRNCMCFNPKKCQVLHLGRNNPEGQYNICGEAIEPSNLVRDLGVQVDKNLSFQEHIQLQVSKANRILGMLRRSFEHLDSESLVWLYKALVRPHLEYCHHIIHPRFKRDLKLIESVQRRVTKFLPGLKDISYEGRLRRMRLPSMFYRLQRGDMIEVYKYLHGLYNIADLPFALEESHRTRGNCYKLKKIRCHGLVRQSFFSNRVFELWNSLPNQVVDAPSVNSFKSRLDRHWANRLYSVE